MRYRGVIYMEKAMAGQNLRPEVPLASMTRRAFDAFDDPSLARAAVEPIIVAVRAKSPGIKSAVFEALSPGRRALFAFWIFYGHAREQGWTLFFREVPYVSEFPDFLGCLRSAFEYIGDEAMISLVSDVEHVHRAHDQVMKDIPTLDPREPRYAAVIEALAPLDRRYRALVAGSLGRVAALVRGRARDFVAFQDESSAGRAVT